MPTVLLVEDNEDNRMLATWILEDEGVTVVHAQSGEQCLELIKSQAFDAVLMDISLPGIDGVETTQSLRKNPKYAELPILALTAHAVQSEHDRISSSGVDGIMTKPLNEDELLKWINSLS